MKDAEIKESIYLPKKLKCGFKLRKVANDNYIEGSKRTIDENGKVVYIPVYTSDEPTYKVGFVSYFDEKGKFRHETSFEGWRNPKVPTEEYENIPTEGFKFFKQANRFSYNRFCSYRNVALEVQDPRGWVFEISHNNLAWIIDNCNINKGVIDGEFVYGWDGKDRVLIPCESDTYKELVEYSEKVNGQQFIQPNDFKPFHIYKSRQGETMMYVGRFDVYKHRREERAKERNLVSMFEKDGWYNIGHKDEYLYGITTKKGKYYFFMKVGKCEYRRCNYKWNGQDLWWGHPDSYKTPKDKFIDDIGYMDDEELQKTIINDLFKNDDSLHNIDYTMSYRYYLTPQDLTEWRDVELQRQANANWLWSIDPYTDQLQYDGKYKADYKIVNNWNRDFDTDTWVLRVATLQKNNWWGYSKVDINMSPEEFIETYKPYFIYHKYDDGSVRFTQDWNSDFFRWLAKRTSV